MRKENFFRLSVLIAIIALWLSGCGGGGSTGGTTQTPATTNNISKEGGILTSSEGASLNVPSNVFSETTDVKITSSATETYNIQNAVSRVFEISSAKSGEATLETPITFTIPFANPGVGRIANAGEIEIIPFLKVSGGWLPLEGEISSKGIKVDLFYIPSSDEAKNILGTEKMQIIAVKGALSSEKREAGKSIGKVSEKQYTKEVNGKDFLAYYYKQEYESYAESVIEDLHETLSYYKSNNFKDPKLKKSNKSNNKYIVHIIDSSNTTDCAKFAGFYSHKDDYNISDDGARIKITGNMYICKEASRTDRSKIVSAHELFHAVQYSYDTPGSYSYEDHFLQWGIEGTPEAMAGMFLAKDKSNKIQGDPYRGQYNLYDSLFDANDIKEYRTQDFWIFASKLISSAKPDFIRSVFEKLKNTKVTFYDAVENVLSSNSMSLSEAYSRFAKDRYFEHKYKILDSEKYSENTLYEFESHLKFSTLALQKEISIELLPFSAKAVIINAGSSKGELSIEVAASPNAKEIQTALYLIKGNNLIEQSNIGNSLIVNYSVKDFGTKSNKALIVLVNTSKPSQEAWKDLSKDKITVKISAKLSVTPTISASTDKISVTLSNGKASVELSCDMPQGTRISLDGRCKSTDAWKPISFVSSMTCTYNAAGTYYPACRLNDSLIDEVDTPVTVVGQTCTTHATKICYNDDVYYTDSCGKTEDIFKDCAVDEICSNADCKKNPGFCNYTCCSNTNCTTSRKPFCKDSNTSNSQCVECLANANCSSGKECVNNVCITPNLITCSADSQCTDSAKSHCKNPGESSSSCVQCLTNSHCTGSNEICVSNSCQTQSGGGGSVGAKSVLMIVDASGSMGGTKIETAKQAVIDLMNKPESNTGAIEFALMAFFNCNNIRILQAFTTNTSLIKQQAATIQSQGATPISLSLIEAGKFISQNARNKSVKIIMMTDGGDNCGPFSPRDAANYVMQCYVQGLQASCNQISTYQTARTVARQLNAEGLNLVLDAVGFDIANNTAAQEQLKGIAEVGGGTYYQVDNPSDIQKLTDVFGKAVQTDVPPCHRGYYWSFDDNYCKPQPQNYANIITSATLEGTINSALAADFNYLYVAIDKKLKKLSKSSLSDSCSYTASYNITTSPVIDSNGNIYFGDSYGYLYSLNSSCGENWKIQHALGGIYSSPAINSSVIYFGSKDTYFYAVNTNDGSLRWKYKTASAIDSAPSIDTSGNIYLSDNDGIIYAVNSTGTLLWKSLEAYGKPTSIASNENLGAIYFGTANSKLYALDKSNGTVKWTYDTSKPITASPVVDNQGDVYVVTETGKIISISGSTGAKKWDNETYNRKVEATPLVLESGGTPYLFVGDYDSIIASYNQNGEAATYLLEGLIVGSPTFQNGYLYVGTSTGKLYSINLGTQYQLSGLWPKYKKDIMNTGK